MYTLYGILKSYNLLSKRTIHTFISCRLSFFTLTRIQITHARTVGFEISTPKLRMPKKFTPKLGTKKLSHNVVVVATFMTFTMFQLTTLFTTGINQSQGVTFCTFRYIFLFPFFFSGEGGCEKKRKDNNFVLQKVIDFDAS